MSYLKDFREKMSQGDYPGFLKIWEEYCYGDMPDGEEIIKILKEIKKTELAKPFGSHVSRVLSLWKDIQDPLLKEEVLTLVFDLQTTNTDDLATLAYSFLKEKYPNDALFDEKIRLIGLKNRENFQGALSKFALLSHMAKGKFVYHTAGWGTGEILEVSHVREELFLEFDYVLEQKHLSFANALKTLIPLPDSHFLARRFGSADLLEKEAKEKPLDVLYMLLKDLGPKTASEIRDELIELVIPEEQWAKWWQQARAKLKKDTRFSFPENTKDCFSILDHEISHEEAFYKALEQASSIDNTIQLIYTHTRDYPEILKNDELKTFLQKKLQEMLSSAQSASDKIQILFLLEDLGNTSENPSEIIAKEENILEIIQKIDILSFKKRVLVNLQKAKDNWQELFLDLLLTISPNLLKDYIFGELFKQKSIAPLEEKLEFLLKNPEKFPQSFMWYFQNILEEEKIPFSDKKGKVRFFEGFLILLDHLYNKTEHKDLHKKMAQLLTGNRYKLVRDMMKLSSLEETKEFLLLSTKCSILEDQDIKIIQSLAEVEHPSLVKNSAKKVIQTNDEVVWATKEGYEKAKAQLEHLSSSEIIQNAKEIEEARSHGDLRENAEYKAALEKRDRLHSELKFLTSQFNNVRVLTPEDVDTKEVGIGTVVTCKNAKGKKVVYTILGPWEANPEKNILSLQSKLAQSIKGLKVTETFKFLDEEFTIITISSYFS